MILQALTRYYEELARRGGKEDQNIPSFGYSCAYVSAIAQIDLKGNLLAIVPAVEYDSKKKRAELVPFQMKRSGSNAPSYFVCDNAQYIFGIEKDGATEKSKRCFRNFKEFHLKLLNGVERPEVKALECYLNSWNPDLAFETEAIKSSLSFCFNGLIIIRVADTSSLLHEVPEVLQRWNDYFPSTLSNQIGTCLVTGKESRIARVHNSVKGIQADSLSPNGWTLVSFDKDSLAFSSYGKLQGFNAPVSEYAAFAYTAALNHLLADRENVQKIGDTTVVCWAESAEPQYQTFTFAALGGTQQITLSEGDVQNAVKKLAAGHPVPELNLKPEQPFYILGLSPNAARLSVRFFYRGTFGELMHNVNAHHERMEIVRPSYDRFKTISLWAMLRETVNPNSRDKSPSPVMSGATARAIFTGGLYPASLLEQTMLRIRAEREITRGKAAIIKAYYLRNPNNECPKEVLTVALNEASTNPAYTLGRLFSVYEAVQEAANPSINTTIKDKYFNSAASTPAMIFPVLGNLSQKHLRKLDIGKRIWYEKQITKLKALLGEEYPARMTLPQQGSFDLGYYHQTQKRYEKKEEK